MEASEGCLLTFYEYVRGTECPTLLLFTNSVTEPRDSRMLRGTTKLIIAETKKSAPLSVMELSPGRLLAKGSNEDSSLYSQLVDVLLQNNVNKYVLFNDSSTQTKTLSERLFTEELRRRGLDLPIELTESSGYSLEDAKTCLLTVEKGCFIYNGRTKEGYLRNNRKDYNDWLLTSNVPVVYMFMKNRSEFQERLLKSKIALIVLVEYI